MPIFRVAIEPIGLVIDTWLEAAVITATCVHVLMVEEVAPLRLAVE